MGSCFSGHNDEVIEQKPLEVSTARVTHDQKVVPLHSGDRKEIKVKQFSFEELVAATYNFSEDCFLGEGGFGPVFRGRLKRCNKVVAVKQLNHDGLQGNKEFHVEVKMLSLYHHPNLVNLVGYCAVDDHRLLVYEYMPLGSLENHLYDRPLDRKPLSWENRMKIILGTAKGLKYLHYDAKPPVIYRDMKCSNILLGENYHPKLSDFGLARDGPQGSASHVSTRVMGTLGYCDPQYLKSGKLTTKSDVYSFGVVLLEIITGKRASIHPNSGLNDLVSWAVPLARKTSRCKTLPDPLMRGEFPETALDRSLEVAVRCVDDIPFMRPTMAVIVEAFDYISTIKMEHCSPLQAPPPNIARRRCSKDSNPAYKMRT